MKTHNAGTVNDFLNLKKFHCYKVVCLTSEKMNSCIGVVACREFECMEKTDIVDARKDQRARARSRIGLDQFLSYTGLLLLS